MAYAGGEMKTSLDLPKDLWRRAKIRAAEEDRSLKDLVAEGLEIVLKRPVKKPKGGSSGAK